MKYIFSLWLLLASFLGIGQVARPDTSVVDTAAVEREVDSLIQESHGLTKQKKYKEAFQMIQEAERKAKAAWGRESAVYTKCIFAKGMVFYSQGKNSETEPYWLEAKSIREKVLGKEHSAYVDNLNNLAGLYYDMGQYEKTEPLLLEAKAIREKVLGKEHSDYATILNNLAGLYWTMGNYEKAEPLYVEAKAIWGKTLGKEHPNYATNLNNLASVYHDMYQYEKAGPLYLEAKAIREKVLGKEHFKYAQSLSNLASLYKDMSQYPKAEPLCLEAKSIREKALGKEHPDYATSLNNLASLYHGMYQYEKAESQYLEAKAIREKVLGKEHFKYALSLNNLAGLYKDMGQYAKAEPLYLEAKSIWEKALVMEHPNYVMILNNLANLYQEMSQYKKSIGCYEELTRLNQILIIKSSTHLSERELNNYTHAFAKNQDQLHSFTQIAIDQSTRLVPLAYSNTLFHKGFLLNAANQVSHLALTDSISTEKYYRLKGYRRRLATQYSLPKRDSALIANLEEKANTLEKDLVRTVAGFGEALRQVTWQEVQQALKKDGAAIEFVHYRYYDQKARATDSTMYAALVLLSTDTAPHFVPLCEARQLNAIFNQKTASNLYYQNIYNADDKGSSPLYRLLWAPLESYLQGINTVYFSPSGLLHRLNLAAVQPVRRETLSDRYHLVVMGSTRNLVIPPTATPAGNTAALFGGIQYEMDSTKIAMTSQDTTINDLATRGSGGFIYTDSTLRGGAWNYLPATEKEIAITDTILKNSGFETGVYRDYAATEEALQKIGNGKSPSPRVLHIATHGFFFPDPKSMVDNKLLRVDGSEPVFRISDNPMIRSGLLLAGANHAWKTGKPLRPGMEDGILTAYEISQMNLRNTELVVLSACETGLGDIQGNEGVYGLQRAFKIAGAKYLLMSLWQVPDKHTQELMEAFYKNWLDGGKSIPEAFRLAQAEMRAKYPNPFYWAGFVLVE